MALKDFIAYMKDEEAIDLAQVTLRDEHDRAKKDAAYTILEQKGLETALKLPGRYVDPARLSTLSADERKDLFNTGLIARRLENSERIGSTLEGNKLEEILDEVSPEALEGLAFSYSKELARGEVKGYDETLRAAAGYEQLIDLEQRYVAGQAKPEELQMIYASVAEEAVEAFKEENKGKVSESYLNDTAQLIRKIVGSGTVVKKELVDAGMTRFLGENRKKLKESIPEGKTVLDYVRKSITALRDDPLPQDSALARNLLYQATKKMAG